MKRFLAFILFLPLWACAAAVPQPSIPEAFVGKWHHVKEYYSLDIHPDGRMEYVNRKTGEIFDREHYRVLHVAGPLDVYLAVAGPKPEDSHATPPNDSAPPADIGRFVHLTMENRGKSLGDFITYHRVYYIEEPGWRNLSNAALWELYLKNKHECSLSECFGGGIQYYYDASSYE